MRLIFSKLSMFVLLIVVLTGLVLAVNPVLIADDDCEDTVGWTDNGNLGTDGTYKQEGSYSLKITDDDSSGMFYGYLPFTTSVNNRGILNYSFYFFIESAASVNSDDQYWMLENDTGYANGIAGVKIDCDGTYWTLRCKNGSGYYQYGHVDEFSWRKINIVADFREGMYDVYQNGNLICDDMVINGGLPDRFMLSGVSTTSIGNDYVDNIYAEFNEGFYITAVDNFSGETIYNLTALIDGDYYYTQDGRS